MRFPRYTAALVLYHCGFFCKRDAVAKPGVFSTEVDVPTPINAARKKIIRTVHPTVLHRPLGSAIKRVEAVRVVERDLVLAERPVVVTARFTAHQ